MPSNKQINKQGKMQNSEMVGVLCARFQCSELSNGHQELLDYVLAQGHNLNIVVLAKTACNQPTRHNPLDIDARMRMINETYPGKFVVTWIEDYANDDNVWSENFDRIVGGLAGKREVMLYGSRDSFINHYFGKYQTHEYKQRQFCSATESRQHTGKLVQSSADFRSGVIWATQNQYDKVFPTVDVAIIDVKDERMYVYVGKKKQYKGCMFIGGFADPKDKCFEDAVIREAKEETNLDIGHLQYTASLQIDDPRYRHEADKIITTFFLAMNTGVSEPKASDDIDELVRVHIDDLKSDDFAEDHRPLHALLMENISRYWGHIMRERKN